MTAVTRRGNARRAFVAAHVGARLMLLRVAFDLSWLWGALITLVLVSELAARLEARRARRARDAWRRSFYEAYHLMGRAASR